MRDERRISRKRKRRREQVLVCSLLLQAFLCAGSWRICAGQQNGTDAPSQATRSPGTPSVPPSISPVPPESLPPNQLTSAPTQTSGPSASVNPSSLPSVAPSALPTDQPSPAPSSGPTTSQRPSLIPSNAPSPVPSKSFLPSSMPSTSSQPSETPEPSESPVPPSEMPSLVPTDISTLRPSNLPTLLPSERPSMSPSLTREVVNYPFIEMVLLGVENNFTQQTWNSFAVITSQHVQDFWNNQLQNSPVEVGEVQTGNPLEQKRLNETEFVAPLWVSYNQTIRYSPTVNYQPNLNLTSQLFLLPFKLNPYPYTQALQNATNNTLPIIIADITLGIAPTPAPTPVPIEIQRQNDNRIIIITVVITGISLLVAGGYIIYLTRKEEEAPGMNSTRHTNYEEDGDDDFYRASGGVRLPSPADAAAIDDNVPIQSSTYHSFQSDTISESNGMIPTVPLPPTGDESESTAATGREGSERGGGGIVTENYRTTSTLPISVIGGDRLDSQSMYSESRRGGGTGRTAVPSQQGDFSESYEDSTTLRDDTTDRIEDDDEIGEPVPPLMTGFQLQIEDLDDMSE